MRIVLILYLKIFLVSIKVYSIFNYYRININFYLEHAFGLRLIKDCNEIIKYFKKSHQPNVYLQQAINELKISGGGLKKFIDTRWTSEYECTLSVNRLERAFVKVRYYILLIFLKFKLTFIKINIDYE